MFEEFMEASKDALKNLKENGNKDFVVLKAHQAIAKHLTKYVWQSDALAASTMMTIRITRDLDDEQIDQMAEVYAEILNETVNLLIESVDLEDKQHEIDAKSRLIEKVASFYKIEV